MQLLNGQWRRYMHVTFAQEHVMAKTPRIMPGAYYDVRGRWHSGRRATERLGWAMLLALLLLTACTPASGTSTRSAHPAATSTLPPPPRSTWGVGTPIPISTPTSTIVSGPPLPPFTDWRVAYIGADQRLHAVSLDGKTDVAGASAPISGPMYTGVWSAGTSPDGKHLAYYGSGGAWLTVLDAASGMRASFFMYGVGDSPILWSPDQRYFALYNGNVLRVNAADGSRITFPNIQFGPPRGWIDANHVALEVGPGITASTERFQSLDVTTGALRPIATIPTTNWGWFSVEPDGALTLFSNSQARSDPFTPVVDLIDNATGAVTPLTLLTQILPALGGFHQVLWRPGSTQALVAMGFQENGNLHYALVDVRQDTATPLTLAGFPVAWSPDGGTLIVATGSQQDMSIERGFNDVGGIGTDPFTLTALRLDGQGRELSSATQTTQATTIPVLGFVRTA